MKPIIILFLVSLAFLANGACSYTPSVTNYTDGLTVTSSGSFVVSALTDPANAKKVAWTSPTSGAVDTLTLGGWKTGAKQVVNVQVWTELNINAIGAVVDTSQSSQNIIYAKLLNTHFFFFKDSLASLKVKLTAAQATNFDVKVAFNQYHSVNGDGSCAHTCEKVLKQILLNSVAVPGAWCWSEKLVLTVAIVLLAIIF